MDLLRSTLKALYYDFRLELAARCASTDDAEGIYAHLPRIVARREDSFSYSEVCGIRHIFESVWTRNGIKGEAAKNLPSMGNLLLPLVFAGKEMLDRSGPEPSVRFDMLLRWRDLSLLIGEDTLVVPALAYTDVSKGILREPEQGMTWPDVLGHNDKLLNDILDGGLADTHCHLQASSDVFFLNWIYLMNHGASGELHSKLLNNPEPREHDITKPFSDRAMTLKEWALVAAAIRASVFTALYFPDVEKLSVDFDPTECMLSRSKILARIDTLRFFGRHSVWGEPIDYALSPHPTDKDESPYMIHSGERRLLYDFFSRLLSGDASAISLSPHIYLYLLIKNKIRREFVQTNSLRGFENFKEYQDEKGFYAKKYGFYNELNISYAVGSCTGPEGRDFMEARITPEAVEHMRRLRLRKSFFGHRSEESQLKTDRLTFVAHFIKTQDKDKSTGVPSLRFAANRKKLWHLADTLLSAWKSHNPPPLTGIDAASSELACRPEIFAPVFRYIRLNGLANFTFHAGEDFFDIADGLRTIDEVIRFMEYRKGDRLGHAVALGTDAMDYYKKRHHTLLLPRQILLDNVVWLRYTAKSADIALSPATDYFISECFSKMASEIGYRSLPGFVFNDFDYWQSMLLRGNIPKDKAGWGPIHIPESVSEPECVKGIPSDAPCRTLLEAYNMFTDIQSKGNRFISLTVPKSYPEDICKIQKKLMEKIADLGVVVETNPSSNLKIGAFSRYIDLPLFRFFPPGTKSDDGKELIVTVNTDDRGVFATSLRNELSLIAAAMSKEYAADGSRIYSDSVILAYIRTLIANAHTTRFKP